FASVAGNTYVIVDNDGTDPVTGTFTGLPEGAALTLAGQSFTVTYAGGTGNDVALIHRNTTPMLAPIGNRAVDEGSLLAFMATATDPDPQTLTFSLDPGAPAGAGIDPVTGAFTWTPTEAQGPGTFAVTVRVTDSGTP